ncbi:MAG: glycosyltransferase family 4 protein [Thermoplasmatales archaeon]|nr:glycosyltransferase family 4 protein [Thermoplasmatales archaeon]MBC7129411.1 glycosyltransferase family 4 protein [Thermoplasmatales archaeon]
MKIAFIYDGAYPWNKGGAEKRLYEIGRRLAERGHEVHWYCVGWWLPQEEKRDIEFDGIEYHGVCRPLQLYVDGRRSIKAALKFSISLIGPLLQEEFDVIDCQNFPYFSCFSGKFTSIINKSNFIITVLEYWGDYWYEYLGKIGVFGKIIEKLTFRLSKNVITISNQVKNDLSFYDGSVYVIPDGVPFDTISNVKPSMEKSDVIFVGRLIKHKNVDILLKALNLIKKEGLNIRCFIIGDGPERKNLEKLTKKLDLRENVRFLHKVSRDDDVYAYMKSSKVFVFPSTREGAALVTLEANAAGLPVITIDHPLNASRELINNKNGMLSDLSPYDLKDKIIFMLNHYEDFKDECISFAKDYTWDNIAKLTERVYKEVLK